MSVVVDTLFDAPFTFELTEDDTIKSLSELRLQYPDIPESILLCEHKRLHYKYSSPLDTEPKCLFAIYVIKLICDEATIIPSTSDIVEQYRLTINKGKKVEDLNNQKTVINVKKRIYQYVIAKVENIGIGNNKYLRWGKRFENVAKSLLQHYIGHQHPIHDCDLQRHRTEACLASSLDGDIPTLDAVAEFKCIYFTTKFYKHMDWNYKEQLESQMDNNNRKQGYWLMCQFDSFGLGLHPHLLPDGFEQWTSKMIFSVGEESKWIQNGIILKDLNRFEVYVYPPAHISQPREYWDWMKSKIEEAHPYTYVPVFWKMLEHKLNVLQREEGWLAKRQLVMRATMRMIEYYRDPENSEKFVEFKKARNLQTK